MTSRFLPITKEQDSEWLHSERLDEVVQTELITRLIFEWKHDLEILKADADWLEKNMVPKVWNGELTGDSLKGAIEWTDQVQTELKIATQNVTYWRNRLQSLSTKFPEGQKPQSTPQDWR